MWNTRHADLRSSDYIDIDGATAFEPQWENLKNIPAATFCGYDTECNCYVATLNTPSEDKGTIWSFNSSGELRWHVNTFQPSLSSLAVDSNGCIYFDDGLQFVCLDTHGNQRWAHPSSAETAAVVILADGRLFVQNVLGAICIYDHHGKILLGNFQLDCKAMKNGCCHAHMPGKLGRYLFKKSAEKIGVSKKYTRQMINRFFGVGVLAKHVPAIVPELNRIILINANGENESYVYGLDIESNSDSVSLVEVFKTTIPGGADTSPAISFDGKRFYCSDGQGCCYCLSTETGEILWELRLPGTSSASPSVSPDGYIYFSVTTAVIAIKDYISHADIVWRQDFKQLKPEASKYKLIANSVLAVTRGYLYGVVSLSQMWLGRPLPKSSCLVIVDRITGDIKDTTPLDHESLCTLSIMPCGSILIPSKPILSGLKRLLSSLYNPLSLMHGKPWKFNGLVKLSPRETVPRSVSYTKRIG